MRAGYKTKIGSEEYTIPAITLGQLRNGTLEKLKQHDELVADGKPYDAFVIRGEVILSCLKANYPEFDEALLWDNIDVQNAVPIWLAVLGISGFEGEKTAAVTEPTGTSNQSTEA